MEETSASLELPGFRFHPTEEELLGFYLKNMVHGIKMHRDIIGCLNIYCYDPWDLPGLAKIGEREWYFFVPRDRKHSNGGRPNRTTEHGFWKATGSDRKVVTLSEPKRVIGLKKTLVFYQGRAPRGCKTDWVMNEFRLTKKCPKVIGASSNHKKGYGCEMQDIVVCKIYRKATSLKELELRAAKEDAVGNKSTNASYPTSPLSSSNGTITSFYGGGQWEDTIIPQIMSSTNHFNNNNNNNNFSNVMTLKTEERSYDHEIPMHSTNCKLASTSSNTIQLPFGRENLGQLQVPKLSTDWAQDPICSLSWSPWLDNLLNFCSPTLIS